MKRMEGGSFEARATMGTKEEDKAVMTDENTSSLPAIFSSTNEKEQQVLECLKNVIDPDFGENIVNCGFVKVLKVSESGKDVALVLELTTPACPVKDEFNRLSKEFVKRLEWVDDVDVIMTASAKSAMADAPEAPPGLRGVKNIIAISSCKGGVGKSTTCVNLAMTLAQMGAKVGIFDADVYGPSLPTMITPAFDKLEMKEDGTITPVEYEGVKVVSFGYAGQGSAIMRGPMVSGLVNQLLTTSEWGELDYLLLDMPPGTGDIHLTLGQVVPITAAVVVTTPQRLAFIDVDKGVRMFAKLEVPCVAVVENMSTFTGDDGKVYRPFGRGSGKSICEAYDIPHLIEMPIEPGLSSGGDSGTPLSLSDPTGPIASALPRHRRKAVRRSRQNQLRSRANRSIRPRPKRVPQSPNFRRQRRASILRFWSVGPKIRPIRSREKLRRVPGYFAHPRRASPGRFRTRLRRDGWKLRGQRNLARWIQPSRPVSSVENVT